MTDKRNEERSLKSLAATREEEILKFWREKKIFEKSLAKPAPAGEFVFYEGPPTANGRPGIHHLEARAFKDVIPRYKTMRGFHVRRKAGWDTHGLPVELEVEKKLGLKSKKEIEVYGIAKFNEECKKSVWTYVDEWERFTERIGYWLDFKNAYVTYRPEYIETLWWIVKRVHERGLLYKDYKVVPWCPRCGTALSSHELAQGYEDKTDPAVTVEFRTKNDSKTSLLAWTTTPWTLPGNVALAVRPDVDYVTVEKKDTGEGELIRFILAKDRLEAVFGSDEYKIIEEKKGRELVGLEYEPLYPFLKDNVSGPQKDQLANAFKVYPADFVSTGEGTGIVHTAVMYGADDFALGTKVGLPKHHLVDEAGKFVAGTGFLESKFVKTADKDIVADLNKRDLLFREEKITHSYPFCWRCSTPLIYFARDSWYIKMSALRDALLSENQKVHWEPEHMKEGRFGEWLREVKDWAISRERYWGTPLPVWRPATRTNADLGQTDADKYIIIDSIETLKKYTKKSGNRYFAMRHGQSDANTKPDKHGWGVINSKPTNSNHLTDLGKKQVSEAAEKLKDGKIDVIVTSDFLRAKESAQIVAEVMGLSEKSIVETEKLRELNAGPALEGKHWDDYHALFTNDTEAFFKVPEGGESLEDVKHRMVSLVYELEKKYEGKNILLVTHGLPMFSLIVGAKGMSAEEIIDLPYWSDKIVNAYVEELNFWPMPRNTNLELDLHRPYIDEIELVSEAGERLVRVPEVMDVWFDSGAMPFAQDHHPFEGKDLLYPADYISEAQDQTRGWFYTLLAVATLLEKEAPYKNVVVLGHVLDAKGKKMSKSVGNVIDPWQMLDKYGADVLRLWMYSVNQPGDSKNFDERIVDEVSKKVFGRLRNVLSFYLLYADKNLQTVNYKLQTNSHILDQWIISRLNQLTLEVTEGLESYKLDQASRPFFDFVDDLSTWWLRRSRERIKNDELGIKNEALNTLRFVLLELSKLLAPFTPFVAEEVHKAVGGPLESVHLESWPEVLKLETHNLKLLEEMAEVRKIVSLALEKRAEAKIPVRQPLSSFIIPHSSFSQLGAEYLDLIREEVNVKEVKEGDELALDINITPELRKEGQLRELTRAVQDLRKKKNLKPGEIVIVELPEEHRATLLGFEDEFKKTVSAKKVTFGSSEIKIE